MTNFEKMSDQEWTPFHDYYQTCVFWTMRPFAPQFPVWTWFQAKNGATFCIPKTTEDVCVSAWKMDPFKFGLISSTIGILAAKSCAGTVAMQRHLPDGSPVSVGFSELADAFTNELFEFVNQLHCRDSQYVLDVTRNLVEVISRKPQPVFVDDCGGIGMISIVRNREYYRS